MKKKYTNQRGRRVVRTCENCEEKFETLATKVRAGGEKFCSRKCYAEYRQNKLSPDERKKAHVRHQRKHKYGVTEAMFKDMLENQKGRCKVCNKKFTNKSRYTTACVDHCHTTGQVRGLLCNSCNRAIGMLGDTYEAVKKAADYLKDSENQ